MKQETTWGVAAALAVVAAVGISTQSGSKAPAGAAMSSTAAKSSGRSRTDKTKQTPAAKLEQPQCEDSIPLLKQFLLKEAIAPKNPPDPDAIVGPDSCYALGGDGKLQKPVKDAPDLNFQPDFIIATLPDPLHTHFSLLFDRFIEAIQQGAQDEGYDYDSSWLPWETEQPSLALLEDQDELDDRKSKREEQPGILLFRNQKQPYYNRALIVFIVGEEPTRGIHRPQFQNAVAWIKALRNPDDRRSSVAVLGPTFSGSLPSLQELLEGDPSVRALNQGKELAIYSGSASSGTDGRQFAKKEKNDVDFRSFVEDDQVEESRFCLYLKKSPDFRMERLAILSEDETAYGTARGDEPDPRQPVSQDQHKDECSEATRIYYPRDISMLRAAYQSQSMFSSGGTQQSSDPAQRKSLPTDLADPGGDEHDTVRRYAGNQTPLSQEAQLLGIVEALRAHKVQYVLLRSSNTLDPLFLANFLRRDYTEARIVVENSDLLFQRGQDAMALSGVMTLSTYPLFSWAREWTAKKDSETRSHRVFPENSTEGTYIAVRLLVQGLMRANLTPPNLLQADARESLKPPHLSCELMNKEIFAPSLQCEAPDGGVGFAPLPDYAPPYWMQSVPHKDGPQDVFRPATWLSVITGNGTWPLAALNESTVADPPKAKVTNGAPNTKEPPRAPAIPRSTKILLVGLVGLALFHALCCWFASFTAKPAYRAHFASAGGRHKMLVLIGSFLIAVMALLSGWGCGLFTREPIPDWHRTGAWFAMVIVCVLAMAGIMANIVVTHVLNRNEEAGKSVDVKTAVRDTAWPMSVFALAFAELVGLFFIFWSFPLEAGLAPANRAFVYWRSMNLTSGASPMVPFLALAAGLYMWFWYALHGLALFGTDRPCLPREEDLFIGSNEPKSESAEEPQEETKGLTLSMFSQQKAGTPAEVVAMPLARNNVVLFLILFSLFGVSEFFLAREVPVRSLGAWTYTFIFAFCLDFYFSMMLTEAWQIWNTWVGVRQLLVFLDRLALRRTLGAMHGFSWGSVWKMSGNVLDVRYKLLSRQLECLRHMQRSVKLFKMPESAEEQKAFAGRSECDKSAQESLDAGGEFSEWYTKNYEKPWARRTPTFEKLQKQIAKTTGVVLIKLLIPVSHVERHSLIQVDPGDKRPDDRRQGPAPSRNELIRNAEELVCLTYLGFAQNLLGRIRTIVLGAVYLFLGVTIAVSSYPFDPRPLLSGALLLVFCVSGVVVVLAYAGMHRDATLSLVTNTTPGELGSEFWFKVVGYGAAPLLGLITQLFPEWAGFLFSWLQPGLSSIK